jgi:hypothetical protein
MRDTLCVSLIALLTCAALGCGADDDRVDVYPVSGKVLVEGQPAEGADVVFYPTIPTVDGMKLPGPAGTTDAGGVYRLRSYEPDDGAPAGEFKVTVVWPAAPPPNATGVFQFKDRLGGRYANPDKSGLKITVPEGGGELAAIELK